LIFYHIVVYDSFTFYFNIRPLCKGWTLGSPISLFEQGFKISTTKYE